MNQRRTILKSGTLLLLGLAPLAAPATTRGATSSPQWAMLIDLGRCTGCQACVIACKAHNQTGRGLFKTRVRISEQTASPRPGSRFQPTLCNHCSSPPCAAACPRRAIRRLASGIVVTDWQRCTGSGECLAACPRRARFLDQEHRKADSCDFCQDRLARSLVPACVESCAAGARTFGDLTEPTGDFARVLEQLARRSRKPLSPADKRVWYLPGPAA